MTFLGYSPSITFAPRRRTDADPAAEVTSHTLIIGRGIRVHRDGAK